MGVFDLEVFVGKFFVVDGFVIGIVVMGEVIILEYEVGDDVVEGRVFVVEVVLVSVEFMEVMGGDGDNIVVEVEFDSIFLFYVIVSIMGLLGVE